MRKTNSTLSLLVICYVVSCITYIYMGFTGPSKFSGEALKYFQWWVAQPLSELELWSARLGMVALLFSIASGVALLFFMSIARHLFLASVIILSITSLMMGYPILITGVENFIETLAAILAGLIIALVYWSPIEENFKKHA